MMPLSMSMSMSMSMSLLMLEHRRLVGAYEHHQQLRRHHVVTRRISVETISDPSLEPRRSLSNTTLV